MQNARLILVLGDQLSLANPALSDARAGVDVIVLAEVREEAQYVRHNRHKIVLLFSAMRHFAETLQSRGFTVLYFPLADGLPDLESACRRALASGEFQELRVCEPGEYRLKKSMESWGERLEADITVLDDTRFLCSHLEFEAWAHGKKQLRMEYFYRLMRQRYNLLLDDGDPVGGQWNFDAVNRTGWRNQKPIPERPDVAPDGITREVIEAVTAAFPDNPGCLDHFRLAVTHEDAEAQFRWFCDNALRDFGTYQDALPEESPWVFHGLISMYLNCGLLEPLSVCQEVQRAWREGRCELAAAEGFIRQILGWREYVRGIYWRLMPDYADRNTFGANRPLPDFFWTAETDMRCLHRALQQSLDHGYAHHIQRLMVIGNFALLAGLDVKAVCEWYLAVYVDAYEWVELPNTAGMALHADDGAMASKPYAASGKYIQKQGNHCQQCVYDPKKTTGPGACPYNSLYWHFIDRHEDYLRRNARMGLILGNWQKRSPVDRAAITDWAGQFLEGL